MAGFTVRNLTPWDDFYLGAGLPIANGVSLSALAHVSRRDVPIGLEEGTLIQGNDLSRFGSKNALAVGYSVGLTFDLDLFERAFFNTWDRIRSKPGQFRSSTGTTRQSSVSSMRRANVSRLARVGLYTLIVARFITAASASI